MTKKLETKFKRNNSIFIAKGTSGTGKSTRLNQILQFLFYKNYEFEKIFYKYKNEKGLEKEMEVGFYFKELNIFIIGSFKISNKSGLESLSSLDHCNSKLNSDGCVSMIEFFTSKYENTVFIMEGCPLVRSFKYRPAFFFEKYDINKCYFQYHRFPNEKFEEFYKRIYNRSGSKMKEGCSSWCDNKPGTVEGLFVKGEKDSKSKYEEEKFINYNVSSYPEFCNLLEDFELQMLLFDEPITSMGEFLFKRVMKNNNLLEDFLKYSETNKCFRNIENCI